MKKYLIIFIIIFVLTGFIFKANSMIAPSSNQNTTPAPSQTVKDVPVEKTFSGEYVCLPHKDTSGPQTLECASGLKVDDGTYVAMDLSTADPLRIVSGDRITATGTFVPVEQLSSDNWQKYPIIGILQVKSASKL